LNTAKNAAIGTVGGGVKRKSELLEKRPGKAGPERAARSQKEDDGTFAGDSAKRLTTTSTTAAPLDSQKASATTTSGQRSKTPVEAVTPKESSTVEKSGPQSFAMDVEDDTMRVRALKTKGDGDDDTAERLLKLRKTLSKVVPSFVDGEDRSQQQQDEQQQPRSRVDSGARPLSRNDNSRPQSRNANTDDEQRIPNLMHRPSSRNTAVTDDQSSIKIAIERPSHATSDRTIRGLKVDD
jgi:hypothetical protein